MINKRPQKSDAIKFISQARSIDILVVNDLTDKELVLEYLKEALGSSAGFIIVK